jgi:molybdenum cofactor biosynthesis protein B
VKAIIINGGTGISRRDSTYEAVDEMLEKRLTGFGEIFRLLTYQDIGSPAIMSRATAGIINGRVLFSIPGSEHAVRLAMEKLILPELGHVVRELEK